MSQENSKMNFKRNVFEELYLENGAELFDNFR